VDHTWIDQPELEQILKMDLNFYLKPTLEDIDAMIEFQNKKFKTELQHVKWVVIYEDDDHLSGFESNLASKRMMDKCIKNRIPFILVETGGAGIQSRLHQCDPSSMEYENSHKQKKSKKKNEGKNEGKFTSSVSGLLS